MPINAESYQNGKIYRIWTLLSDEIYIGSTADTLSNRFCNHKSSYKRWLNGANSYYSSFKLFQEVGLENCKIELEHNFPCNSKAELNSEEGRVQRIHKDKLINKNIAGRLEKQYRNDNKDKLFLKFDCECGGYYTNQHKSTHLKTKKHKDFITDNQSLVVAC
jgi:hypothetical protein